MFISINLLVENYNAFLNIIYPSTHTITQSCNIFKGKRNEINTLWIKYCLMSRCFILALKLYPSCYKGLYTFVFITYRTKTHFDSENEVITEVLGNYILI